MAPEHQIGTYENLIIKTIHTFQLIISIERLHCALIKRLIEAQHQVHLYNSNIENVLIHFLVRVLTLSSHITVHLYFFALLSFFTSSFF